jgi:hypothetical protein
MPSTKRLLLPQRSTCLFLRSEKRLRFVVSHISRKTSEIWGTPRFVEGRKTASLRPSGRSYK